MCIYTHVPADGHCYMYIAVSHFVALDEKVAPSLLLQLYLLATTLRGDCRATLFTTASRNNVGPMRLSLAIEVPAPVTNL